MPDCLLRQLCKDLGHPVEELYFAHHVFQGDTLYLWPPERDHYALLPVGQGLDRGRAEPAGEILSEAVGMPPRPGRRP